MEERDLHYASVLRTRKLTVAGIEPVVVAASDDDADVQLADAIRALMEAPQIPELMFDLLDGLGKAWRSVKSCGIPTKPLDAP
ncbi:DUF935 family protein [Escherichia coli]|uniref:phage portal protein family protein n=1 Tax=Escherichia coli TaxID=562 RepID=UPI00388FBEA8